jgi:hypothetical protein
MPCGGIVETKENLGRCFVCDQDGATLWVEEWDTGIHYKCFPKFIASNEGACLLSHGHGIHIEEQPEESMKGLSMTDFEVTSEYVLRSLESELNGDTSRLLGLCGGVLQHVDRVLRKHGYALKGKIEPLSPN